LEGIVLRGRMVRQRRLNSGTGFVEAFREVSDAPAVFVLRSAPPSNARAAKADAQLRE
jgi:hypothetical protein